MPRPRKIKSETTMICVRVNAHEANVASAIATLRKETLSDVLRGSLSEYIRLHKQEALESLSQTTQKHAAVDK